MSTPSKTISMWLSDPTAQERIGRALQGVIAGPAFAEQCIIASRDTNLARCSPEWLLSAFLTCAQIGLSPGRHGLVALIPRGGEVQVQIQWQGYKALMERIPGVRRVVAVLVHMRDEIEVQADGQIQHTFDPFDPDREFSGPEDLRGGYLRIEFENGSTSFHTVSRSKIERNRACAKSQNVWRKWYPEMVAKTIIRDAWNRRALPYDPATVPHIVAAEEHDRGFYGESPSQTVVISDPSERALTWEAPEAEETSEEP